jgi:hypothetical protein
LIRLKVDDQVPAHGDDRLAPFRPERRHDVGRPRSPVETGDDRFMDAESIHERDDVDPKDRLLAIAERRI